VRAGGAVALALVAAAGCAHRAPVPTNLTLRPDTELGTIALRVHGAAEAAGVELPATRGSAAAQRAVDYTATSIAVGAQDRSGVLLFLAIVASPVTATVGAIVGAAQAGPARDPKPAEEAFARAFVEADLTAALRARLLGLSGEKLDRAFVESADGAGTVLDIHVMDVRLAEPQRRDGGFLRSREPWLALHVTTELRLVRVADGFVLFSRRVDYRSETAGFWSWAEDDAARFRAALRDAVEALAREVVEEVL
jgi:hypothetical protein